MKTNRFLSLAFFAVVLTFSACSGDNPSSNSGTSLCAGEGYDPAYQQCNNGVVENKNRSSSSSRIGYCNYGPRECYPMDTEEDVANCAAWGQVVNSCPTIYGYCNYGPGQWCYQMYTEEDVANCAVQGQVVSSCPTTPSSSSSTPNTPSSSSGVIILSSSSSIVTSYCDYGPITEYGGGCFPMATEDDEANCAKWGFIVNSCTNPKCGTLDYNLSTQFCYNNSKVGNKCGTRTEVFDPDLYSCIGSVISLKNSVSYGGESYGAVLIGTQTWMAKNLNYTPSSGNHKCPDNTTSNCTTYGRQYDWATAMDLVSSYNTTLYTATTTKHKGICPTGWHIPSSAEWSTLVSFVGSTPGIKLRAPNTIYVIGNQGTNDYGFSALLGGYVEYGSLYDSYKEVGSMGVWWTATQYEASNAYNRAMSTSNANVNDNSMTKRNMLSVRCIKD